MVYKKIIVFGILCGLLLPAVSRGVDLNELLRRMGEEPPPEEVPQQVPQPKAPTQQKHPPRVRPMGDLPCPEGRECVVVASFTKADHRSEAMKYQVAPFTAERGFDRLVILQHIGEKHGVIVNTVKVRQGRQWLDYAQGLRLPQGRTEMAVPVPSGTPELVISFDHGRGAALQVILERPRKGK